MHVFVKTLAFTGLIASALILPACSTLTQVPQTEAASALTSGEYTLDQNHAALQFKVSHFGLSDYTGRFTDMTGQLDFDADNPEASRLSVTVDVTSLKVMPFTFIETLIGADWLDTAQYSEARFDLDSITVTGGNTGTASGMLTLKGISKPIDFDVTFIGGARHPKTLKYAVGFDAKGKFKRSDYGIDNLLSVAGDKFDFDTIKLEFNGEFVRD